MAQPDRINHKESVQSTRCGRVRRAIGAIGANSQSTPRQAAQIRYANLIAVCFFCISSPTVALLTWQAPRFGALVAGLVLLYLAPLLLNHLGFTRASRLIVPVSATLVITVLTLGVGTQSWAHLSLFVVAALPFVLFDIGEYKTLVALELFPALAFAVLASGHRAGMPAVALEHEVEVVVGALVILSAFAGTAVLHAMFYFNNQQNEDALRLTVTELEAEVNERRRMEQELVTARDAALVGARVKTEFLATMSHEIRTPLNGVIGMASLLAETRLDDEQRDMLATVTSSGQFLLSVINDVLDFSKIDAGKVELEAVQFDVQRLFGDALLPFQSSAGERGLHLSLSVDAEVPARLKGDPARLRQVITNLVGNAIKFTNQGSVRVRVRMGGDAGSTAMLRCEVADTGVGIPEHAQSRIFDAFTQADSSTSRRFGGTGLGLSICNRLVKMMGGEIGCTSQPDLGSLFWFTTSLERVGSCSPSLPAVPAVVPAASKAPALPRLRRVLVVEDSALNARIVMMALRGLEVECVVADNGKQALDVLEKSAFDLVLMDVQMPVMDGLEATRRIRQGEAGNVNRSSIPIVALSAGAFKEQRDAAMEAGADEYVLKPISAGALKELVVRMIPGVASAQPVRGVADEARANQS